MMAGGRWCSWQVAGDGDHGMAGARDGEAEEVMMAGGRRW